MCNGQLDDNEFMLFARGDIKFDLFGDVAYGSMFWAVQPLPIFVPLLHFGYVYSFYW